MQEHFHEQKRWTATTTLRVTLSGTNCIEFQIRALPRRSFRAASDWRSLWYWLWCDGSDPGRLRRGISAEQDSRCPLALCVRKRSLDAFSQRKHAHTSVSSLILRDTSVFTSCRSHFEHLLGSSDPLPSFPRLANGPLFLFVSYRFTVHAWRRTRSVPLLQLPGVSSASPVRFPLNAAGVSRRTRINGGVSLRVCSAFSTWPWWVPPGGLVGTAAGRHYVKPKSRCLIRRSGVATLPDARANAHPNVILVRQRRWRDADLRRELGSGNERVWKRNWMLRNWNGGQMDFFDLSVDKYLPQEGKWPGREKIARGREEKRGRKGRSHAFRYKMRMYDTDIFPNNCSSITSLIGVLLKRFSPR